MLRQRAEEKEGPEGADAEEEEEADADEEEESNQRRWSACSQYPPCLAGPLHLAAIAVHRQALHI